MICQICKTAFNEHTGRRPKKFCSDKCKVAFWNKNKKPKVVEIKNLNQTTNEIKPPEQPKTNFVINTEKIAELEKELEGVPDFGLGKRLRRVLQDKIYKLKYSK